MHENRRSMYEVPKINENRLKLNEEPLGKGNFGTTYSGRLRNEHESGNFEPVAVKMAHKQDELNDRDYSQVLQQLHDAMREEIDIMARIGYHENILKLIGWTQTTTDNRLCLVTEFCAHKSLDKFLSARKMNFVDEIEEHCKGTTIRTIFKAERCTSWASLCQQRSLGTLTTSDLLCFAYQIANGMDFLHCREVIHRDLALRNILLTSDFVVKIGDFGLSRRTCGGNYLQRRNLPLPFKWTAPEALMDNCVPIESDHWTFGILLWELFTLGEIPYKKFDALDEVLHYVVNEGKRLDKPPFAPVEIYELMLSLWSREINLRPALKKCKQLLMAILKAACPPLFTRYEEHDGYEDPRTQHLPSSSAPPQQSPTKPLQQIPLVLQYLPITHLQQPATTPSQPPTLSPSPEGPKGEEERPVPLLIDSNDRPWSLTTSDRPMAPLSKKDKAMVFLKKSCRILRMKRYRQIAMGICAILILVCAAASFAMTTTTLPITMTDCYDWRIIGGRKINGVYRISPSGIASFDVWCDMITDGGGWTVFQKRQNNSLAFEDYLWSDYKVGFPNNSYTNYWMGLDRLHVMSTKDDIVDLRVDIVGDRRPGSDCAGCCWSLTAPFTVGSESTNYKLNLSSSAKGSEIPLYSQNGMQFSTQDRDHDTWRTNCATDFHSGGWWFSGCFAINLNGRYDPEANSCPHTPAGEDDNSYCYTRIWGSWTEPRHPGKSEMKLRKRVVPRDDMTSTATSSMTCTALNVLQ